MIRFETKVVKKYFEPLDVFVRLRVFSPAEIAKLLETSRLVNRRGYIELVVNATVVEYNDEIVPQMGRSALPRVELEERLYDLSVDVNPGLDIRKITVPAAENDKSEIHLLEDKTPAGRVPIDRLSGLEEELRRHIVGQDEAIGAVSRALRKAAVGLRDPRGPISTLFFVGQTGVGKTELARILTESLYGGASHLVRIDCSEYALPHEYAKLLGSPPGYVGYDEGGLLSSRVLQAGGTFVVLFDEIEKSDNKVHDLMLQIMDDGQVTDNHGRPIDFTEALVILTSNVGSSEIARLHDRMGFSTAQPGPALVASEMISAVKAHFKPEFLNRINEIVVFKPLGLEECERIVARLLERLKSAALGIPLRLEFEAPVSRHLARLGFSPEWGARELRRTVEREVESPLSDLLLQKKIAEGDTVVVGLERDRLRFARN